MARLAAEINALVEDELRAFNAERFYAGEKGVTPSAMVEAARIAADDGGPPRRHACCGRRRC